MCRSYFDFCLLVVACCGLVVGVGSCWLLRAAGGRAGRIYLSKRRTAVLFSHTRPRSRPGHPPVRAAVPLCSTRAAHFPCVLQDKPNPQPSTALIIAKTTGFQAMSNQSNGNIIQLEDGWNNVIKKGVSSVRLRLRCSRLFCRVF
jgi:hypothetical protein